MTNFKNIAEATEVRKSGYPTKIHASPHKAEIDDWIVTRRWSSNMIVNELKRLYPDENHPSNRAVDNYRHKYLPLEFAGVRAKVVDYPQQIIDEIMKSFNPAVEGVALWQKTKKVLDETMKMMENLKIPPKILNDLLKTAGTNFSIICDVFASVGLIEKKPTELSLTHKKEYGGIEDIREQYQELEGIIAAIERIEKTTELEVDRDENVSDEDKGRTEGENREGRVEGKLSEEHGNNGGEGSGVQGPEVHN